MPLFSYFMQGNCILPTAKSRAVGSEGNFLNIPPLFMVVVCTFPLTYSVYLVVHKAVFNWTSLTQNYKDSYSGQSQETRTVLQRTNQNSKQSRGDCAKRGKIRVSRSGLASDEFASYCSRKWRELCYPVTEQSENKLTSTRTNLTN